MQQPKRPARRRAGNHVGKKSFWSYGIDWPDEGVIDRSSDGWPLGRPIWRLRQLDVRALTAKEIRKRLVGWLGHGEKRHVAATHGVVQRSEAVCIFHVHIE